MKEWMKFSLAGGGAFAISLIIFLPEMSNQHDINWSADWVQAIISLLAVIVALFLPFFLEKKRREAEQVKRIQEELDRQNRRYDEETATLIQIYHYFEMLSKFFWASEQVFKHKDAQILRAMAYKNPGSYPSYLLDERNDLTNVSGKLIGENLFNFSQAVGAGREVAFELIKIADYLTLNRSMDTSLFASALDNADQKNIEYALMNIAKGNEVCNKLMEECNARKKKTNETTG